MVDNGHGGAGVDKGTGIRGLVDRADALGGTVELTSADGRGTRLRALLPISAEAAP